MVAYMGDKLDDALTQTWASRSFSAWWQQRLSIALQLGNARCILARAGRDLSQLDERYPDIDASSFGMRD